jgi:hypothetical protein
VFVDALFVPPNIPPLIKGACLGSPNKPPEVGLGAVPPPLEAFPPAGLAAIGCLLIE